jgi:hypothetical protein
LPASYFVLTVFGATRSTTYRLSLNALSFTLVDTRRSRCGWAPLAARACQRGESNKSSYYLIGKARVGDGDLTCRRRAMVPSPPPLDSINESRRSVFRVDTTYEERGDAFDPRQVATRSFTLFEPDWKDSSTALYRSSEKISVTLTLMPFAKLDTMAGKAASVAGILMKRFGRSTSHQSPRASAAVRSAPAEIRASTSMDTRPSTRRCVRTLARGRRMPPGHPGRSGRRPCRCPVHHLLRRLR